MCICSGVSSLGTSTQQSCNEPSFHHSVDAQSLFKLLSVVENAASHTETSFPDSNIRGQNNRNMLEELLQGCCIILSIRLVTAECACLCWCV